jgi:mevalonate kinase
MGTAIVWALMKGCPERQKNKVVKLIEDKQHGNSSGVDQTIVREGGVISYQRGVGFRVLKKIVWPEFLLIDSGKPVESTGEMVAKMAERWKGAKEKYEGLFKEIGKISEGWEREFDPGELIKKNQRLLEKLGVVSEKAKAMVREIEKRGGAAKICGGGGVKRGSGILLAWYGEIDRLKQLAAKQGWKYYQVKLGVEGVRYEKN